MRKVTKAKAAEVLVKIIRTGGEVKEVSVSDIEEPTVADALRAAQISVTKGDRIRIDGESVDTDTVVENGDIITLSGKVSGGAR